MICKLICDWLFQNVGIIAVAYTSLYLHRNETGSRSNTCCDVIVIFNSGKVEVNAVENSNVSRT